MQNSLLLIATPDDRAYIPRFREILGTLNAKVMWEPQEYLNSIAARLKQIEQQYGDTDVQLTVVCTCKDTLPVLLKGLPDFRHPLNKNGSLAKLSLDDYAGSFFKLSTLRTGTRHDVQVLILNPLAHLVTTASGPFLFKRYISKITKPETWFPQTQFTWEVFKPTDSDRLFSKFSQAKMLAVDIETYVGDSERRISLVGYCGLFADGSTHSVVVHFDDLEAYAFVKRLNATNVPKLFQRGKYDNTYFARWNVVCNNWLYDTLHMFHSWYAELPKRLDFITAFTVREIRYWKDDSAGSLFNQMEYNAKDCWATMMSFCSMMLEAPSWAIDNYCTEFPMVFPCLHCDLDGLAINLDEFHKGKAEAERELSIPQQKLAAWISPKFNPNSPQQCVNLLKVLGVKNVESADAKVLAAASTVHPINELILSEVTAYKKQAKLLSTYFKEEKFWHSRLFYELDPAGTDTGRLASSESNFWCGLQIQNIPRGKAVKRYVVADEGWLLAENDYSQSEARCVAYLSGCNNLINLVEGPLDYHKANAEAFFGVPYKDVDKELRDLAKRVNHGSNYNMGEQVLLETMGIRNVVKAKRLLKLPDRLTNRQVCGYLLKTYEKAYPEIKLDWYGAIKREITLTKKLKSSLGWTRIFFDDVNKSKPAFNSAVAHGPQNLSVSIINKVFYRLWKDSVYGDLKGRLRIKAQIHDSILYAYRVGDEEVTKIVGERMQYPVQIKDMHGKVRTMLIPNDCSHGKVAWGDLK